MADEQPELTDEQLAAAAAVIGLTFTPPERELMRQEVQAHREAYTRLRAVPLDNNVPPALRFDPRLPEVEIALPTPAASSADVLPAVSTPPADLEELAFASVTYLAALLRTGQISSLALTEMYLARLKRYDPLLHCVVTLTEERALAQARQADAEIAAGRYRGPLHGIPWGAKDLLAVRGTPTTWGATPYREQVLDLDATVVERLDAAGAVLVAKLSLGALAWGDVWFGGTTRNPWNLAQGSSGSSAGSASAVAAGLVGFAIGTETHGSIVSPATRCGVSGLRPTFGRVSRHGAMALSWSMDKIGPMARSVEDCALIFDAIYGPDGKDLTVADAPFAWNPAVDLRRLRIGYLAAAFAEEREHKAHDDAALAVLRDLGADLIPMDLPDYPIDALGIILSAEAAAAFDDLTRSDRDDLLERQVKDAWPNTFRAARLIPAVEYIQAQRVRTLLMQAMAARMAAVDVYVAPSFVGHNLLLTNLTGHPAVVLPNGFTSEGAPTSLTFTGRLYDEGTVLAVAHAYQAATDFHRQHPPGFQAGAPLPPPAPEPDDKEEYE